MSHAGTLVLVVGPIAAGKSTLAAGLAATLRERGRTVALCGLDEVADGAQRALPDWDHYQGVLGALVAGWLRTPVDVVVAEGPNTPGEVAAMLAHVPGARVVTVLAEVSYAVALERVGADPTRGLSRDPALLRAQHARFAAGRDGLAPDVVVDTGASSPSAAVETVLAYLDTWPLPPPGARASMHG